MRRRDFLTTTAILAAAACAPKGTPPLPPGTLSGADRTLGHRLRQRDFPPITATRRTGIVIVGGGVGGLSAAWRLSHAGMDDFLVVEMENEPGGNSRSDSNAVSAYPLAAHYLPLPPPEAVAVRMLLAELGAIEGDPQAEKPRYNERLICHAPQERLYRDGMWQEGLLPKAGGDAAERSQQQRFQQMIGDLKRRHDAQGRRAFAVPMARSSRADDLLALDRTNFRDWLLGQGFTAPSLLWLADYVCRDDFGTIAAETSAWAGLHYFASRAGEAENAIAESVLTAPEGNGWLVRGLAARVTRGGPERLRTGCLVWALRETKHGVEADVFLPQTQRCERIVADRLLWASPAFILPRVAAALPDAVTRACSSYQYAPWLVANLSLRGMPEDATGVSTAWDNVLHSASGLGYVVATHQQLRVTDGPTVWTYYRPLSDAPPSHWRTALEKIPREAWAAAILDELSRPHGNLAELVTQLDVHVFGHAMVRPVPGLIWGTARQVLEQGFGRVHFAHADVSGMSLFEEANDRGLAAAESALQRLGRRVPSLRG